jgi:hypothetical protein
MSSNIFPAYRAVYELMWENTVEPDRPQTVQCGASAIHAG